MLFNELWPSSLLHLPLPPEPVIWQHTEIRQFPRPETGARRRGAHGGAHRVHRRAIRAPESQPAVPSRDPPLRLLLAQASSPDLRARFRRIRSRDRRSEDKTVSVPVAAYPPPRRREVPGPPPHRDERPDLRRRCGDGDDDCVGNTDTDAGDPRTLRDRGVRARPGHCQPAQSGSGHARAAARTGDPDDPAPGASSRRARGCPQSAAPCRRPAWHRARGS